MEFLFDAVFTSSEPIPAAPTGSGEPGRVWTEGGELTGRSLSQVMQSIVTKPDFPAPIRSSSGRTSRLWPAAETKAYLDTWLDRVGRR